MNKQKNIREIGMIAACISDTVLTHLYDAAPIGYIGVLDKISGWAEQFYDTYYEQINDWETFEGSAFNVYHAVCWDDFVIAWAGEQLQKFLDSDTISGVSAQLADRSGYAPKIVIEIQKGLPPVIMGNKPILYIIVDLDKNSNAPDLVGDIQTPKVLRSKAHLNYPVYNPHSGAIRKLLMKKGF